MQCRPEAAEAEKDDEMATEQTELGRLEVQELELRRKRGGANLSEMERVAIDQQADQLSEQAGLKRRKMEREVENAAAYA